jgi:GNAT superfamily N-acetyltransferase
MLTLRAFRPDDAQAVIDHVLAIQRQEFGLPIDAGDQPDLLDIVGHYQRAGGGFWVALVGDRMVGTLGLLDIGGGHGVLRKMFVEAGARGRVHGVAPALLDAADAHACRAHMHTLWLGTTEAFAAAHRFYDKQGFERIDAAGLPDAFPRMALDTRFYRRGVDAASLRRRVAAQSPC